MTPREIAAALGQAKKSGDGYMARCPCHDDGTASLSIAYGKNRKILIKCHAGCDQLDVIEELKRRTVWPIGEAEHGQNGADKSGKLGKLGTIVAVYDYTDERGAILFQNVRYEPKTFRQRRPEPSAQSGFIWTLGDVRRVLYRLPEVAEAARRGALILIAEGEKDADNLHCLGFTATTAPMGGGKQKWRPEFSESLRGGHVAILPDNDQTGRDHAQAVKAALEGIAASVCIVTLPGLRAKGDVSDWIAKGGTCEELLALIEAASSAPEPPTEDSNVTDLETERLARLGAVAYERERTKAAKKLGMRASMLDKVVAAAQLTTTGLEGLKVNRFRQPLSCLTNCLIWLAGEKERLKFNRMQRVQEIDGKPMADADLIKLHVMVENIAGRDIRMDHVREAVEALCNEHSYHPVIDFLEECAAEWREDGESRVDGFAFRHLKTEDTEFAGAVSRIILIGAARRMIYAGELFRYMPILIGDQEIGKSSALKKLFGDWHYRTNTGFDSDKIAFEIQGMWCLEAGEMHAYSRSTIEAVNNFVSRQEDRYRAPWGRFYIHAKRCLICVGTSNKEKILGGDETGDTRFLPVKCGLDGQMIDTDGIARDRRLLWGEAYIRAKNGEDIWLKDEAKKQAAERQEDARQIHPWEELIARHLLAQISIPEKVYTLDVLRDCCGVEKPHLDRRGQMDVAACLVRLGYQPKNKPRPRHYVLTKPDLLKRYEREDGI
jgi:Virulence-associated protein E